MYEPNFTPEDWEVFAEYGRTMLSLQEFEETLIAAVTTEYPDSAKKPFIDVVVSVFRMSGGQLKGMLERMHPVPDDLVEEINTILRCRNKLAHRFLTEYIDACFTDASAATNAKATLAETRELTARADERLNQWANELQAKGRLARVERNMRASPEERRQRAKAIYDDLRLHMELGYLEMTGLEYDPEHDCFRFPDGGLAVSRTDADWMGLLLRPHVGL